MSVSPGVHSGEQKFKYVTLPHSHKYYNKALRDGQYAGKSIQLIKSFCVNTASEYSTFKVIEGRARASEVFFDILKVSRLHVTAFLITPILIFISHSSLSVNQVLEVAGLLVAMMFFFSSSVNIFNDYYDYLSGKDRLSLSLGSGALRSSYLSPKQFLHIGYCFFSLGIISSMYLLSQYSLFDLSYIILSTAFIILLFLFVKGKARGIIKPISIFLCYGPLLFLGFSRLFESRLSLVYLGFSSMVAGLGALFYFLNVELSHIMGAKERNQGLPLSFIGFDRSLVLLKSNVVLILTVMTVWFVFIFPVQVFDYVSILLSSVSLSLSYSVAYFYINRIGGVSSPLSFNLTKLSSLSYLFYFSILLTSFFITY
ncbi:MAG: hypothetical protein HOO06_11055 [Bdellovibrionaceae bacterium]|jgi:1,4-dihydroxy-2-naphthoate octaprenyltransferase|nr:hypothetical protein [Pseudobdellovibrionaceae bacterium]